ncbi:hypothetical protein GW17_00015077 [Ensete ventricosum]|nr:hypothetical protein GW17_00015077 [Ensete ventricosum]RZR95015.1 hypothetical protein BHM03_00023796 [Ensete ventricosum]
MGGTYRYTNCPLPGGSAKNRSSTVDFDRRRSIEEEIDRRRSIEREIDHRRLIEEEKGKNKRKREKKKRRRRNTSPVRRPCPPVVACTSLPPAGCPRSLFLPREETEHLLVLGERSR